VAKIIQAKRIVAEYRDNIIIIKFEGTKLNEYIIPKSRVNHYDGRNLHLSISGGGLSSFGF